MRILNKSVDYFVIIANTDYTGEISNLGIQSTGQGDLPLPRNRIGYRKGHE